MKKMPRRATVVGGLSAVLLVICFVHPQTAQPKDEITGPSPSPLLIIEYKNTHYILPPVPAGDAGHMLEIQMRAPGTITKVTWSKPESTGPGCRWVYECPDQASCPEPYRYPVVYAGNTAYWHGWSNSGENCALYFRVYWDASLHDVAHSTRRVRNFSASVESNGQPHDARAQVNPNGTILCTAAFGNNPINYPPSCYVVLAPGGGTMSLKRGEEMGTSRGGTMRLTCNGQAPLSCSVRVDD